MEEQYQGRSCTDDEIILGDGLWDPSSKPSTSTETIAVSTQYRSTIADYGKDTHPSSSDERCLIWESTAYILTPSSATAASATPTTTVATGIECPNHKSITWCNWRCVLYGSADGGRCHQTAGTTQRIKSRKLIELRVES